MPTETPEQPVETPGKPGRKGGRPSKFGTFAILQRRHRIAQAYLAGTPQWQIAKAEKVSTACVCRDLNFIREQWMSQSVQAVDHVKAEQLAKIDRIEAAAWKGYERSCKAEETKRHQKVSGKVSKDGVPLPDQVTDTKTRRGQAGDPRFLERVSWCVETRLKLIGALKQEIPAGATFVTVVGGIDMAVITGQKPGVPLERINSEPAA